MPLRLLSTVLLLALLALSAPAAAQSYERYHPDQRFRSQGLAAMQRGDHAWARHWFRKAAHYADKPSQAMLAELYWEGLGAPRDRALAYAWMDLAAERRYRHFLVKRELYWDALDAAERERALAEGAALYARYGDAVAKPRLEAKLRSGRRQVTGSRTGFRQAGLRVYRLGPSGFEWDADYYADRHWLPDAYWEAQDRLWRNPLRGVVTLKPLQAVLPPPRPRAGDETRSQERRDPDGGDADSP